MRSLPVAALVVLFTALLGTPAALAHTSLQKSTPAAGASLAAPPTEVSLTFGEAVRLPAAPIRVAGPDGAVWTVGNAVTDATVTAPVTATGPAGAYTVHWQVISDDGDTIRGTIPFTLTAPAAPVVAPASPPDTAVATPTPAPAAATPAAAPSAPAAPATDEGGAPGWLWALGGVAVLAVAAGVVLARRARS